MFCRTLQFYTVHYTHESWCQPGLTLCLELYLGWSLILAFLSRLVEHTLCLEQLHGCFFQPLYTCTQTNLRVIYSGQIRGWSESTLILTIGSHLQPLLDVVVLGHCLQGLHHGDVLCSAEAPELIHLQEVPLDWLVQCSGARCCTNRKGPDQRWCT